MDQSGDMGKFSQQLWGYSNGCGHDGGHNKLYDSSKHSLSEVTGMLRIGGTLQNSPETVFFCSCSEYHPDNDMIIIYNP